MKKVLRVSGKTTCVFLEEMDRRIDGESPEACQALATDESQGIWFKEREGCAQCEQLGLLLLQGQMTKE